MFIILGSIYFGIATPTEAAAVGAVGALVWSALLRKLSWQVLKTASLGALKITSWGIFIMIGAQVLTVGLAYLKIPAQLAAWATDISVNRYVILAVITFFYVIMGMFVEAISMIMVTIPIIYPILRALGFDSIWLGVYMVIMIEMAQITPPVGVNLYVIHGLTGGKHLDEIIRGIVPFFICQILTLIIVLIFPSIATWLPATMK